MSKLQIFSVVLELGERIVEEPLDRHSLQKYQQ